MSATQAQLDYTQVMYIAYYGRPADPGGLQFWGGEVAAEGAPAIAQAFGTSQEFNERYGSLDNDALVRGLYQQLFGRDADPEGLAFYSGGLERGDFTLPDVALRIIDGVQPDSGDALIVANRLLVANFITNLVPDTELRDSVLDRVTADPASVDQALDALGIDDETRERFELSIDDDEGGGKIGIGAGAMDAPPTAQTMTSGDVVDVDALRADPRFADVDGAGYTVVVLDTGIDLDHPAFGPDANGDGVSDRIVYHRDFSSDGDGTANDVQGHGSNVASIVGSSAAAYEGVAPGVNIIALQVLGNDGFGSADGIQRALQWVVDNHSAFNVVAVNLSLGGGQNYGGPTSGYASDEFAALNALGIITVAAAGNDYYEYQTEGVSYPAADPNAIAVGATFDANVGSISWGDGSRAFSSDTDRIVPFSQRSDLLTPIFAPGAVITGAAPGGGTSGMTGTSQAAPHIAGIAALAQQIADDYLGRRLTPDEFVSLLAATAVTVVDGDDEDDNVVNTGDSYGRVNVLALAEAIVALGDGGTPTPAPVADTVPGNTSTTVVLPIGGALQGEIDTRGDTDWYRVELEAGTTYRFAMRSLGLEDPWLAVHGPDGARLASNNDAGGSLNAALDFVAPSSSTYFLSAEAFEVAQTGSFLIEADLAPVEYSDAIPGDSSTDLALPNGGRVASAVDFGGDTDWLRMTLQPGVTYTIRVEGSESGGGTLADPVLEVFDAGGALVGVDDDGGPGLEPLLNFTPAAGGTFYAGVRAFGGTQTGSYAITLEGDEDVDSIPGDTGTTAGITVGEAVASRIDFANDEDWFAVSMVAGQQYVINLAGGGDDPLPDAFLSLHAATGEQLASNDDGGPGLASRLAYTPQDSGTFYIAAAAFGSNIGDYRLSVDGSDEGAGDVVNGVAIGDAGNSRAAAAGVAIAPDGTARATGSSGFGSDDGDYYRFTAPAAGIGSFALTGLAADIDIRLEDGDGNTLAGSYAAGSASESFSFSVDAGTEYFLRVDPFGSAASAYTLDLALPFIAVTGANDIVAGVDIGDAGAGIADAYALPDGTFVRIDGSTGFGGDAGDVYRIVAAGEGLASFAMSGLRSDIDIRLYNANGVALASSTAAGSSDEFFDFPLRAGSTYYLQVYPYRGESEYSLEVQLPGGAAANDIVGGVSVGDAGDAASAATTVSLDAAGDVLITGSTGVGDDAGDYYGFTVGASGTAYFDLFGLGDDLDMALFDAGGQVLAYDPAYQSDAETLAVDLAAGASYVLGVFPWEDADSDYTLVIDTDTDAIGSAPDIVNGVDVGDAGNRFQAYAATPDAAGWVLVDGAVGFGNDRFDAVTFTVGGSGDLVLDLYNFAAPNDLDLTLVDGDGNEVAASRLAEDGAAESITYAVEAGETYTAEVYAWAGASTYFLDILTPLAPAGAEDVVGGVTIGDAPDNAAAAYPAGLDTAGDLFVAGSTGFGSDEGDFYTFVAQATGTALLQLSGLSADIDLGLRDAAGALLASSTAGGSADESIRFDVVAGQQYTVQVDPYGSAESDYTLLVDTPVGGTPEIVNGVDIGDAGDRFSAYAATPDATGWVLVDGSVGFGSDPYDAFTFTVGGSGDLRIDLYNFAAPNDLDLTLFDGAGNEVAASRLAEDGAAEAIVYSVQAGATYTAEVYAWAGASTYFLDIVTPLAASAVPDTVNGVVVGDAGGFGDAYALPGLTSAIAASGSTGGDDADDAISFVAAASGLATFALQLVDPDSDADLDLYLLDSNDAVVAFGEAFGTADEAFEAQLVAGEPYTLVVNPYSGASGYDLFMSL